MPLSPMIRRTRPRISSASLASRSARSFASRLERIKRTYEQNRQYGGEISEGNVLDTYKRVQLLIIDDMGKEPATECEVCLSGSLRAGYE